jgi:fumarate hydratase class I
MGVSCLADRNLKAKINCGGVWAEKLEERPEGFIPERYRSHAFEGLVVTVDLNRPMAEVRRELSKYPGRALLPELFDDSGRT